MNCHDLVQRRIGALVALTFISAVMLAASCSDDEDAMRTSAPEAGAKPVDATSPAVPDDGGIHRESQALHALITLNEGEVEHSTLAQTKASNESVKEFASHMITDHGAATERLATLAQQKGIAPEANRVSDTLKSVADATKARLEGLSGAAFDKGYMDAQITSHVQARALIDGTLTPAMVDPDMKRALADLRATIEGHLLDAERIRRGLDASTTRPDSGATSPGVTTSPDAGRRDSGLELPDPGGRDSGLELPDPGGLLRDAGFGFE